MRNKQYIDVRDRTLVRNVERAMRAQGVSLVAVVKRQLRKVLRAVKHTDASVEVLAREFARRKRADRSARAEGDA